MEALPNAQLTHVGMFVKNLAVMKEFYCHNLGMVVTDEGPFQGREFAFLSRSPDEHHQMVMIQDPLRSQTVSALSQVSFRLDNLESLRTYYAWLMEQKATGLEGRNHGNSWSLYFFDPEENKIELYVPTEWHVPQPWRQPLDLLSPVEVILQQTSEAVTALEQHRAMSDWSSDMRTRLGVVA